MVHDKPRITAKIAGYPLHPLMRPFAIGYFIAVCACDLLYAQANIFVQAQSADFAPITEWRLGVGLAMALLTGLIALIDWLGERRFRVLPDTWMFAAGGTLVMLVEGANLDLRWSGGAPAIAPMGLILSLSAVAVLLATPSQSWARMYR